MLDSGKRMLPAVMLWVGVLQAVVYYLVGALSGMNGEFAIAQPDTLLYCQAARRIAEGHPFSFSAGTAVCTGTTSHLYPFLLAIPYWLGATGETLFRVGFVLNALFYLVFLFGWWLIVREVVQTRWGCWTAGLLLAVFGQSAYSAFTQSDIGLWMAISSLFLAGLVRHDMRLYGPLLVIGPWVRPEGMVCVVAFVGCAVLRVVFDRVDLVRRLPSVQRCDWAWGVLGIVSVVGVFALNFALTGACQFSSVSQKGHFFVSNSLATGIARSLSDFVRALKDFLLGQPKGDPANFYFLPIFSALISGLGVLAFDWRRKGDWRLVVWLLAMVGGLLSVASSGWMDTNNYRYIAWLLPTMLVLSGVGVGWLRERFPHRPVAICVGVALLAYAGLGNIFQCAVFARNARTVGRFWSFASECERTMETGASMGTLGGAGIAYGLSSRRLVHVPGIYSPELFDGRWPIGRFEIMKNQPSVRFDYWMIELAALEADVGFNCRGKLGQQVLVGPDGKELLRADWSRFDAARRIPTTPYPGLTLKARVDVAYADDERKADYEILPRYMHVSFDGFMQLGKLGTQEIVEGGRLVVGQDEMTVPTIPGKNLAIVMRTGDECKAYQNSEFFNVPRTYAFANPLKLNLQVDGLPAGMGVAQLATNAFSDVTFTIPGKFITKERSRIAFCGDHVAYAYWFYQ